MKMNKALPGEELILEKPTKVSYFPEYDFKEDNFKEDDFVLANLLAWLRSFNFLLVQARAKIQLSKPLKYPDKPTIKNLVNLIWKNLNAEKRKALEIQAKEISERYRLTNIWNFPIQMAILTDSLLVPVKEPSIKIYVPDRFYPKPKKLRAKNLRDLYKIASSDEILRAEQKDYVLEHPSIYLTDFTKTDAAIKWLNENRALFEKMQLGLTKKRLIRRDKKTIFWAMEIWIIRQKGIYPWNEVEDQLELKAIEQTNNINPVEKVYWDNVPNNNQLRNYYLRFLKSLRELN